MSDLISRQAAIDKIGALSDKIFKNIENGATFPKRQWFDGMASAEAIIKNLPSAQPYTDEEIQKMQDIEQAQLDKAYEMGKADAMAEIIRCRDCKLRDTEYCNMAHGFMGMKDDDYCSYAERREGNE